jgi:hypothetical protein
MARRFAVESFCAVPAPRGHFRRPHSHAGKPGALPTLRNMLPVLSLFRALNSPCNCDSAIC